jgi:porin
MNKKCRKLLFCQCFLLFQFYGAYVYAQDSEAMLRNSGTNEETSSVRTELQGPSSVESMLLQDQAISEPALTPRWARELTRPYFTFKQDLQDRRNLAIGGDYNLLYQHAGNSPGEDNATGGVIRFFGAWTATGKGTPDTGSLVFKVENRHRFLSDIAPSSLAQEIGYSGLTAITFSDAGSILTNLYWRQSFKSNKFAFVAGVVDATDYVATYALVNPWTDFSNYVFSTNPTIAVPNQGLGAAVRFNLSENYYFTAGVADANGDPTDPMNSFDTFFGDREYFKHIELGWAGSWEKRFTDNIHLTAWHVDESKDAGLSSGHGLAFSFSRSINERWLPFLRLGYSDGGGGVFYERLLSTGFGYHPASRSDDILGIGLSWDRPSIETYGAALNDEYTAELYYRYQLTQLFSITPDLQYLVNPALDPDEGNVLVVGLRGRLSF